MDQPCILRPFDKREAITVATAADIAGRSDKTIVRWCETYAIGRQIVGRQWAVSRPALQMLLDGNHPALRDYLAGDRTGPRVAPYFGALQPAKRAG